MNVRTILIFALLLVLSAAAAPAAEIVGPDTAETGVAYIPWVFDELPSSCFYFESMVITEEPFAMVMNVTLNYYNPNPGQICVGMSEQWEDYPEFIFSYPGTWTIRVEQRTPNFGDPDAVSVTGTKQVVVTGAVPTDEVTFSVVKALYR
ncbi:hypothetical protein KDK88_02385 [bacterium]|nr:hypothetical protein [bacterium]HPF36873.1 hypothetical protein [Candidatus Krumholzibacteria bacterium]